MIRLLKIFTIGILLSSCSRMATRTIDHSITLDENTTFCIANDEDKIGTIRNLKQLFEEEGFHIVPFEYASKAMKNRTINSKSEINRDIEKAFNIKNIDAVYSIILDYRYSKDITGLTYESFKYDIVSLNTGKTVVWGYSYTSKTESGKRTLKTLVKEIKKKLKK